MDIRNPRYNADETIDCEINHPQYGWIPFTAHPQDPEGKEIWIRCKAGEAGEVARYVAPEISFEEQRAEWLNNVDMVANAKRNSLTGGHDSTEIATWSVKQAEAKTWLASRNDADAPLLAAEAAARQVSVEQIVGKIIANSTVLLQAEAAIAGHRGLLRDRIRAVTNDDLAALRAIDIETGWPV